MSKYDQTRYDDTTFGGRVGLLILRLAHGNQSEFARQVGLSRQHVNQWLKQDRATSGAVGRIVNRFPDVRAEWLVARDGEAFATGAGKRTASTGIFDIPHVAVGSNGNEVQLTDSGASRLVRIDRFTEQFGRHPRFFADYLVIGDAMSPFVNGGDLVMIERHHAGQPIVDGGVYLLAAKGGGSSPTVGLRRLRLMSGRVSIEPENRAYQKQSVEVARFDAVAEVLGLVRMSVRIH